MWEISTKVNFMKNAISRDFKFSCNKISKFEYFVQYIKIYNFILDISGFI